MTTDVAREIIGALYLFLPAYIANMMPVFAARLNLLLRLNVPVDCGFTVMGKQLFGKNKTVRGFVVGILAALSIGFLQYFFAPEMSKIALVDYSSLPFTLALAFLVGFGALLGDSVKSFVKRQLGKKPGTSWPIADQIDYVIGGLLFLVILVRPSLTALLTILIFSPLASAAANLIGYWLRVKKVWW